MRVSISSAKPWEMEQFIALRNNLSGWHVVKHPLSLTSIEEKSRGGSGNPATINITWFDFEKEQKNLTVTQKNTFFIGTLKTFNLKTLRTIVYKVPVFEVILVRILSHSDWSVSFRISPYSVQMQENADQDNSEYGHFSCRGHLRLLENKI